MFTARYPARPPGPPTAPQTAGPTAPSLVFSATDSITARTQLGFAQAPESRPHRLGSAALAAGTSPADRAAPTRLASDASEAAPVTAHVVVAVSASRAHSRRRQS